MENHRNNGIEGESGRIIRRDQDGLTVTIDRGKLTKASKAKAIKSLEELVSQLKD